MPHTPRLAAARGRLPPGAAGCGASGSTSRSICTADRAAPGSPGPAGRPCGWATMSRAAPGCTRASCTGRASCARGTRSRTSGTCSRRSTAHSHAPPDPERDRVEMAVDPTRVATIDRRLRRGRRRSDATARRAACERGQSLSAMAGIVVRRAGGRSGRPARRTAGCSSPAARPITRPPRASWPTRRDRAGAQRRAHRRRRRLVARRTARGCRSRGALHRRRQRSAAHCRDVATCRSSVSTDRRSRNVRRRGDPPTIADGLSRCRRPALPPVRSARLRHRATSGACRGFRRRMCFARPSDCWRSR